MRTSPQTRPRGIAPGRRWPRSARPVGRHRVGPGAAHGAHRIGQLLRVQAHGRDLRPGPRRRGLHAWTVSSAWAAATRAAPRLRGGPGRPRARVRRLRPRVLHAGLRRPRPGGHRPSVATARRTDANLQAAYDLLGIEATVLGMSAGEDTNAAVVRPDTAEELGLAAMSDLAAVAGSAALRPAARTARPTRSAPAPSRQLRHRLRPPASSNRWRPAARRSPTPWPDDAIDFGLALLDAAGHRPERLSWSSRTTSTRSRPRTSRRSSATTSWPRSRAARRRSAAILDPVSAAVTTEVLTELGVRVAVDQEDIEDVAADFLASLEG